MAATNSTRPLTDVAIRNLKPGVTLSDVGENRGLRVSKGKSGVTSFFYRYLSPVPNEKGEKPLRQIKIGTYPEVSLSQARGELVKLKALRSSGVCPLTEKRATKVAQQEAEIARIEDKKYRAITVEKLIERYLTGHVEKGRKKKGADETRRTLYNDPVRVLGHKPAVEVTSADVMALINEVLERGANVQAGNVLRELTAAFDFSSDLLPEGFDNPCYATKAKLQRRRVRLTSKRGKRVLDDRELTKLLKWLPGSLYTPTQKSVLLFTLLTGARTGEVCDARWSQIDLEAGTWYLCETKTDAARYVQLSTQAIEFLKSLKRVTDKYLFPSQKTGLPIQQKSLTEQAWRMRQRKIFIDLPQWTPHDLRRTVRTGLSRMGCPSEVGEAILGHSKAGIEGTYDLHTYEPQCREWLQRWCDHLDKLGGAE